MDNIVIVKSNALLISRLLHSRTQAHIFHFKTENYSMHKALKVYYESIVPLLDSYTETFQGIYGIISINYESFPFINNPKESSKYFKKLLSTINKTLVQNKSLQNILETIYELIYKTIYLLENLK